MYECFFRVRSTVVLVSTSWRYINEVLFCSRRFLGDSFSVTGFRPACLPQPRPWLDENMKSHSHVGLFSSHTLRRCSEHCFQNATAAALLSAEPAPTGLVGWNARSHKDNHGSIFHISPPSTHKCVLRNVFTTAYLLWYYFLATKKYPRLPPPPQTAIFVLRHPRSNGGVRESWSVEQRPRSPRGGSGQGTDPRRFCPQCGHGRSREVGVETHGKPVKTHGKPIENPSKTHGKLINLVTNPNRKEN